MADMGRNAMTGAASEFNRQYQQKAEKALSDDRMAQYQNQLGRYSMDLNEQQLTRQQDQQRDLGNMQIDQGLDQARRRQKMQLIGDIVGAIAGTNNATRLAVPFGQALGGGASFGFEPYVAGRSGLLGSLASYTAPRPAGARR